MEQEVTRLIAMRGYSGSGKSTRARDIAKEIGAVVVCRDDLRKMLLGSYWTGRKEDEDRVTIAEETQVESFLRSGVSVVVDATHLVPQFLRKWARLATRLGVEFEVVDVYRDVDDCKRNDHARMLAGGRYVGDTVINRQARRYPESKWPSITAAPFVIEPAYYRPGLPSAIIVDIDGTLAHMTGRSPYDYSRVSEDAVDPIIADIVCDWRYTHRRTDSVLIVSGRDHTCRADTVEWLGQNDIGYDALFMRSTDDVDDRGNKRPDYMVKYDIFNSRIRNRYNVQFVLDDRDQVVEMWRKLGLKCLQVAEGAF